MKKSLSDSIILIMITDLRVPSENQQCLTLQKKLQKKTYFLFLVPSTLGTISTQETELDVARSSVTIIFCMATKKCFFPLKNI